MNYAFNICSANYLPYAKATADSLIRYNPDYRFVIFLLDVYPEIDASYFLPHTIVHVPDMNIPELSEMNQRYDIFELSCALKPFASEWILKNYADCAMAFYFDSDILIYDRLSIAEDLLINNSVLLTPHVSDALEYEERIHMEKDFLRTGVYNGGFFGVKNDEISFKFLKWWKNRLKDLCFNDAQNGLFVDQLWLNFVPLIFTGVAVLKNTGYNMAYWNIAERNLSDVKGNYIVNSDSPLVFFHFSGFDIFNSGNTLSKFQKAFTFESNPEVQPLFDEYRETVLKNNDQDFFNRVPRMGKVKEIKKRKKILGISYGKML